ncbi:DUF2254 domain-containing protein [Roseobacter litoralis]|uniref:DUF2254 domain-containing protein n=1 Tax=Roseobacter litoralis (strain ATCC 49566 / DSM 6996 / JCM 21268 / NBRC 15278 / OCh 149) TaxID=391595 RepID=F7ZBA9_ROSLO|nr:DUF2254 family protein [Roseobacter litoralis]AEI94295.1 hypothetical protein RLO149_c023250 [Roseobacter litoralis Och 149]
MDNASSFMMTLFRKARRYARKLWVRVVLIGLLAVLAVALSQWVELYVPDTLSRSLDGAAADRLLQLIASAMLAVTIFSITVMVSVYQSSSTQWTPRVHRLIMQDRTTQNTLAVFIGAYVYALLGIILRELGVYDDDHAFVLFWMTVFVLAIIVVYLIRWVLHLQGFGQLTNTTRQVEAVTRARFNERLQTPCLGAMPLVHDAPESAKTLNAWDSGYIQCIYPEAMNTLAKECDVTLYMTRDIGSYVFTESPVLYVDRADNIRDWESFCEQIREMLVLSDLRSYDQDPRFGLLVLGEIGSKALSPGINDPGTAIDIITRIGRILSVYKDEQNATPDTPLDHLYVAPLDPIDLMRDGFGTLARDGVAVVEVQQMLQQTLGNLIGNPDPKLSAAACDFAQESLARALKATAFEPDRDRICASAHPEVRGENK